MDKPIVLDTPNQIMLFHLRAAFHAIRLEQKGIRFRRSVKAHWARRYGMPVKSTPEAVMQRIEQDCIALGFEVKGIR
jgi:NAD-dependent oxidoreductase involved in siderophore biosynthesis